MNAADVGEDGDTLARECAAAMYGRDAAAQHLGITIDEVRAGYARLSMRITATMVNGYAIAHGGLVFTLADTAFAYACNSRNVRNVALQCSISYTAPGRTGDVLVATAQEQTAKGRTGVYDVTVEGPSGPVALFRGVSYRIEGTVKE